MRTKAKALPLTSVDTNGVVRVHLVSATVSVLRSELRVRSASGSLRSKGGVLSTIGVLAYVLH